MPCTTVSSVTLPPTHQPRYECKKKMVDFVFVEEGTNFMFTKIIHSFVMKLSFSFKF